MRNLDLNAPNVLQDSLVISASAGSGKTFTLSVLVTATLGQGEIRPYEILGTTFSEASAADLRERLLRPIDLLAGLEDGEWEQLLPLMGQPDGNEVLTVLKKLALPESLAKSREEVRRASAHWGSAPWTGSAEQARSFWRRTRREAELMQVSTLHALSLTLLSQGPGAPEAILDSAHPALLRLLRQTLREALDLPPGDPDHVPGRTLLTWAKWNWDKLSSGYDGHRDALGNLHSVDLTPLRQELVASLSAAELALAPFAADPWSATNRGGKALAHFKPSRIPPIPSGGADLSLRMNWVARQSQAVTDGKGKLANYYLDAFRTALDHFAPVAEFWEAWLGGLLNNALLRFESLKADHGMATFGDLVRSALEGLTSGALIPPRPKLLLVDEYQDTSGAQDAFLAALEPKRTVRVGDLKQAIYGFRGGDPELLKKHLQDAGPQAFRLPSNFRSAPPIVALANRYVDELWPTLDKEATELDGRQEPAGGGAHPIGIVRTEAPSQGADLPGLSPWIIPLSREGGWAATLGVSNHAKPRRRALLLNKRTKLPALLRKLKKDGIRPYVVAKEGFWESPGVRLLMAALEAVAHPDRQLPCVCLLRNLAGLTDGELTALAGSDGRGLPRLENLNPEALPERSRETGARILRLKDASAQEIAGSLLAQGNLLRMLSAQRIHGAMEPLRARRNLDGFLAMLLELPASPAAAFAMLEELRNGEEKGDLPASAEGADLVIQTVHGSKGLEYEDVLLPLLNSQPQTFRSGEVRTDPNTGALALAWKVGRFPGASYRALKPLMDARQRRDDLNLLYVALTRAQERMCLLLQQPATGKTPSESKTWAQFGMHLGNLHEELRSLEIQPPLERPDPAPMDAKVPPEDRSPLPEVPETGGGHGARPPQARAQALKHGELIHGYLQDLLVRWEDPVALAQCLDAPPAVDGARANALRFLKQFEDRGWRHLRRRTEYPIAGAAASGALGRADLVVWEEDRIQLMDFKHSHAFSAEELEGYRIQLERYAQVLAAREGLPVVATLVALRSGDWVGLEV